MVENIRFLKKNMTRIDGYFYSFDEATDSVVQKTDDGTLAFSYPLDTPITREVLSLEYDGESFWSLEHRTATASDGFFIKRWVITNFIMTLQQTFEFDTDATDTFESSAFTVEKYTATLVPGVSAPAGLGSPGAAVVRVTFSDDVYNLITPGTRLFLGPSTAAGSEGETESVTVASAEALPGAKNLTLSSSLTNSYASGDPVKFSKNLWFFNEHFLKQLDVGGLYKINALSGSILGRTKGGAFIGVDAAGFADLTGIFTGDLAVHNKESFLIFIRTTNLLFIDVLDSNLTTELSSIQNNFNPNTNSVHDVFDLAIEGNTIFRLQEDFFIAGSASSDQFNYQLATFKPFPTAIALTAVEAIVPADAGGSTSTITAKVTDQYALAFGGGSATIEFTTSGGGTGASISPTGQQSLPATGIATATYTTGDSAGLVTITAQVRI